MPEPEKEVCCLIHIRTTDVSVFVERDGRELLLAPGPQKDTGGVTVSPPPFDVFKGDKVVLRHSVTGSLIGVTSIQEILFPADKRRTGFIFEPSMLHDPNSIGMPPVPQGDVLLPPSSARIAVGFGSMEVAAAKAKEWGQRLYIVHEQYWRRGKDSYSLAPGQTKTVTAEQTSGVTLSTESEETLNLIVGASVSGSYGPFSASLSASLTYSAMHRSQETLSMEMSTVTESEVTNRQSYDVTVFSWELVDLYHLYNEKKHIMIESTQSPPLLRIYPENAELACCDDVNEKRYAN